MASHAPAVGPRVPFAPQAYGGIADCADETERVLFDPGGASPGDDGDDVLFQNFSAHNPVQVPASDTSLSPASTILDEPPFFGRPTPSQSSTAGCVPRSNHGVGCGLGSSFFDAQAAARNLMCQSRAGNHSASRSFGLDRRYRRLLWLRWLGVLRGESASEWLAEARKHRASFAELLSKQDDMHNSGMQHVVFEIDKDLARCFMEVPFFQTAEVRGAMRKILIAHSLRHQSADGCSYVQGFHELAAVMLFVCMEGSAPHEDRGVHGRDQAAYAELFRLGAAPADAFELLEAILYRYRLIDMFKAGGNSEVGLHARCSSILDLVMHVDDNLASEIESWGIPPHVLLLRWVRLIFLREFRFPDRLLFMWDVLFADVATCSDASSAAFPLVEFVAAAMILQIRPTSPEHIMRYSEQNPPDFNRLLADALRLRAVPVHGQCFASPSAPQQLGENIPAWSLANSVSRLSLSGAAATWINDERWSGIKQHAFEWAATQLEAVAEGVKQARQASLQQIPPESVGGQSALSAMFAWAGDSQDESADAAMDTQTRQLVHAYRNHRPGPGQTARGGRVVENPQIPRPSQAAPVDERADSRCHQHPAICPNSLPTDLEEDAQDDSGDCSDLVGLHAGYVQNSLQKPALKQIPESRPLPASRPASMDDGFQQVPPNTVASADKFPHAPAIIGATHAQGTSTACRLSWAIAELERGNAGALDELRAVHAQMCLEAGMFGEASASAVAEYNSAGRGPDMHLAKP